MRIDSFKHKMVDFNFCILSDDVLFHKLKRGQWEVYDDGESTRYNSLEDAVNHRCKSGDTIGQLIDKLEDIIFRLDGGRGANGGQLFTWSDAGGGNSIVNNVTDLPVRMNNAIKVKTRDNAIAEFRRLHGNSDIEHAIAIDSNGFVNSYTHGGKSTVIPGRTNKGDWIIHNHPNNSSFSGADMLTMAGTHVNGVVATYNGGYRVVSKGEHFNAVGFTRAVQNAQKKGVRGKDFDSAIDNFLRRNQRKYGYKFEHRKD